MSKFDYTSFCGGYDTFAVSKEKFTKEEAIDIAKVEMESVYKPYFLAVGNGFVRHRAGINEDGEPCVGWWLEYKEYKRSCPCWVFHLVQSNKGESFKGYEYIQLN